MTTPAWHGWSKQYPASPDGSQRAKVTLHIGPMRGRKGIALYVVYGTFGEPLAYFRSEEAARKALAILDHIMQGEKLP